MTCYLFLFCVCFLYSGFITIWTLNFHLEMLGFKKCTDLSTKQHPWAQQVLGRSLSHCGSCTGVSLRVLGQLLIGAARQADENAGAQLNLVLDKQPKMAWYECVSNPTQTGLRPALLVASWGFGVDEGLAGRAGLGFCFGAAG